MDFVSTFLKMDASYGHIWVDTSTRSFVSTVVGWALVLSAIVALTWLAARVLFGVAAYNDAMAKNNSDAIMWGLLIGFLGLIPGIIYLCVRNSPKRMVCCPKCGYWHSPYEPVCPKCGEPNHAEPLPVNPYMQVYASRAKKQLIAAIVCLGVMIIFGIVGGISIAMEAVSYAVPFTA